MQPHDRAYQVLPVIEGLALGFLAGAAAVGLAFNRAAFRWQVARQLMERGMVRIFETRLGMPKGTGWIALETWKSHGYGLSQFVGTEVTPSNFPE